MSTALALGTRRDHLEETATFGDLAAAAAQGATGRLCAGRGTAAVAVGTPILTGEFDGLFGSGSDLVERQFNAGFEVVPAGGASPTATASAPATASASEEA